MAAALSEGFQALSDWLSRARIGPTRLLERELMEKSETRREAERLRARLAERQAEMGAEEARQWYPIGHLPEEERTRLFGPAYAKETKIPRNLAPTMATIAAEGEKRERERQEEQTRRTNLAQTALFYRLGVPPGEEPVHREDILRYTPTPGEAAILFPPAKQWDPRYPLVSPTTGETIRPAEPPEAREPRMFKDYNPLTQEPYEEQGVWKYRRHTPSDQELQTILTQITFKESAQALSPEEMSVRDQAQDILTKSAARAETLAGVKAKARLEETDALRRSQILGLGYPGGIVVNRKTLANETAMIPTVGAAEDLHRQGTHKILSKDEASAYNAGLSALDAVRRIRETGGKLFTGTTSLGVIGRGVVATAKQWTDLDLGQIRNDLKQQEGRAFEFVRMLQRESRISDADLRIITGFLSIDSVFQSKEGFQGRIEEVRRVIAEGLRRVVDDVRVPPEAFDKVTIPGLQSRASGPIKIEGKTLRPVPLRD